MKKILAFVLAAFMLLAVAACTASIAPTDPKSDTTDNSTDTPAVTMTAQEILDSLKKSLGGSWASDTAETEDRMSGIPVWVRFGSNGKVTKFSIEKSSENAEKSG